ncbi:MAG: hypothetical protein FWC15_03465 [Fibromonadales bacterium]|nr:hypothetical protein [Fibromonadales bacterium]
MNYLLIIIILPVTLLAQTLDVQVLRVQFRYEETDNSLTTGRGFFEKSRGEVDYWQKHINFAKNYFEQLSGGKVSIDAKYYGIYTLPKFMIEYNRTSRKKGEKMEAFDSARAALYVEFINDVLELAKNDITPREQGKQRVIMIAHAGANRLVDGGTMGTRGANTPGDFMDTYIDSTWGEFWPGFEVAPGDSIKSVIVTSETASQDGLNWGINGTITSQIGRELGLPYSFDVVKGYSRLGYFDGMDFAGYNAGNGFFPSMPSAWMRAHKGWAKVREINKKETVEIGVGDVVKIPINSREYILLENRQRTTRADGKVMVGTTDMLVDSIYSKKFLDTVSVVEYIDQIDAAIPASGIAVWHVNDWYVRELLPQGAINAWNGPNQKDHQFGIALKEASGVLGLGKEFKNSAGESIFYFGSGSDLIPHKRMKSADTVFSIFDTGYANTASTFGGYSGVKITAKIPSGATPEKSFNGIIGDTIITWRALKYEVEIEWVGKYARPIPREEWPYTPTDADFEPSKAPDFTRILEDIDNDGVLDGIFIGNNRLYAVDTNGVPLKNYPVILSNGEPFMDFNSKPLALDIDGCGALEVLIPTNNGLILAVKDGKLLKDEFPLSAGIFEYEKPDTLLLYLHNLNYLFAKHRDGISAFYLPEAKEFIKNAPSEFKGVDEITEFFIFPNPIRQGRASIRYRIGNVPSGITLDIYDITGVKVFSKAVLKSEEPLDLSNLGSDVYSARLTVKFASGKRKEKWVRIGVIR